MEKIVEHYIQPVGMRSVQVVFVTRAGKKITDKEEWDKYKGFPGINMGAINAFVDTLRPKTNSWKKSIIIVYEDGRPIDVLLNKPLDFEVEI